MGKSSLYGFCKEKMRSHFKHLRWFLGTVNGPKMFANVTVVDKWPLISQFPFLYNVDSKSFLLSLNNVSKVWGKIQGVLHKTIIK